MQFPLFYRILFDLVTLDSPFALGPTGFAVGGALKPPLLIAFHRSARGRLETAGAVIAFFMQPSADWPAANQRLVYTR